MARQLTAFKADAFTKNGSGGSPTGVVLHAENLDEAEMRSIADQAAVSHTAFVIEPRNANENLRVRFFTPQGEILNCGHGTIAAHYVRAKIFGLPGDAAVLQEAKEGLQRVELVQRGSDLEIFLEQNEIQFSPAKRADAEKLLHALGINSADLAPGLPLIVASPGSDRFLLALRSGELVNVVEPDFAALKDLCAASKNLGCFVYSLDEASMEASARMFAPAIGVNEDVINGNSSGCLGAYVLQARGGDEVQLRVSQGKRLGREGLVKVSARKIDARTKTVIGGAARITDEILLRI